MRLSIRLSILFLSLPAAAMAQLPDEDWDFEDPYTNQMLYLHSRINYAYDLEWQFEWERRKLADNALRINTGSVSSDLLLTDVELNVNEQLNDKWRFQGRFFRDGLREHTFQREQLLFGLERLIGRSSGVYVTLNPEFNKEFLDLAAGYTWYGDGREEYLRVGVLLEDFNFESKNNTSGRSNQDEIALQWTARMALGREWYVYTEGQVGSGFEREFTDAEQSPEIAAHDRSENRAQLRFSTAGDDGTRWSVWADWWDFSETKAFRVPGFDYEYTNTQVNLAAEHTRIVRDRHRLRFLLHFVDQSAASRGFNEHDYERSDILGGVFYEYLWAQSAATLAYAMGQPDIAFMSPDRDDFVQDDYRDKIIVGYRYVFSDNSQIRLSVSHEVAEKGFGGGAVQYQLFF